MTKRALEEYTSKRDEIAELEYKLEHLKDGDALYSSDIIFDYRTGFPRPQAVVGFDHAEYERRRSLYSATVARLKAECSDVELWIESIPDSQTRRIFRMRYLEGMTQERIGDKLHMERSNISKRIDKYLQRA